MGIPFYHPESSPAQKPQKCRNIANSSGRIVVLSAWTADGDLAVLFPK